MRLVDLPVGSLVRVSVDKDGYLTSKPYQGQIKNITATVVVRKFDAVLLGWKEKPETRNYWSGYREYLFNYQHLQFRYFFWTDGLIKCELAEYHPDQKCFDCQIPLSHIEKADPIFCTSCQFLQGL